jgi:hypothetical protein
VAVFVEEVVEVIVEVEEELAVDVDVYVFEPVTDQVGVLDGPDPGPTCNKQLETVELENEEGRVTPT